VGADPFPQHEGGQAGHEQRRSEGQAGGVGQGQDGDCGKGQDGGPPVWVVGLQSAGGPLRLAVDWPPRPLTVYHALDSVFLIILAIVAALLSYVVARMAALPLKGLADAAGNLGRDLDHPPLSDTGPSEVASAARAFNAMQAKLKSDLAARRHMLAAITHDLQTPITRLRLRLEKVKDPALRERLVCDLGAMQDLVREGLDLARSADRAEAPVSLDLDSLLASLVEDEADAGRDAVFIKGCGRDVLVRPLGLRRAIANLIENALTHGGSVAVSAEVVEGQVVVHVRDYGPGVPEDQLDAVLEPFVRLETSRSRETGGAGLGLTIARTLAEQSGASLRLTNHPAGGLDAILVLLA
jgi:signal transduction histidine kinase